MDTNKDYYYYLFRRIQRTSTQLYKTRFVFGIF